jgi:hypothetical protein
VADWRWSEVALASDAPLSQQALIDPETVFSVLQLQDSHSSSWIIHQNPSLDLHGYGKIKLSYDNIYNIHLVLSSKCLLSTRHGGITQNHWQDISLSSPVCKPVLMHINQLQGSWLSAKSLEDHCKIQHRERENSIARWEKGGKQQLGSKVRQRGSNERSQWG